MRRGSGQRSRHSQSQLKTPSTDGCGGNSRHAHGSTDHAADVTTTPYTYLQQQQQQQQQQCQSLSSATTPAGTVLLPSLLTWRPSYGSKCRNISRSAAWDSHVVSQCRLSRQRGGSTPSSTCCTKVSATARPRTGTLHNDNATQHQHQLVFARGVITARYAPMA